MIEIDNIHKPVVVCVEPQMSENIGMAARAMANFGLYDLRLVKPRDVWPNEKARKVSAHGADIVDTAKVFADLPSAVFDLNFIFASTARKRKGFKRVFSPIEAAQILRQRAALGQRVGILFGCERCGLSNEDISFADEIVTFPVHPKAPSLNIAQAVLLMAYEWMKIEPNSQISPLSFSSQPASRQDLISFFNHLENALEIRGYFRPLEKKKRAIEDLRALLTRPGFSDSELKLLHGIISSLDYFSSEMPRGAGYPERKKKSDILAHRPMHSRVLKIHNEVKITRPPILLFDSGIGGLSVLREIRTLMPERSFIYVADDAGFPYGDKDQESLDARILYLIGKLVDRFYPEIVVISCNTASTLSLINLRKAYPETLFVGTVPAIKPAAERTCSGLVSVLSTVATTKSPYTHDLIAQWANRCEVNLVGSSKLAIMAENWMKYHALDEDVLKQEIQKCFVEHNNLRTDVIVLACTHYPFLVNFMRKIAPWPVDWIDSAEAIARRVLSLARDHDHGKIYSTVQDHDVALFTSENPEVKIIRLMESWGLSLIKNCLTFDTFKNQSLPNKSKRVSLKR